MGEKSRIKKMRQAARRFRHLLGSPRRAPGDPKTLVLRCLDCGREIRHTPGKGFDGPALDHFCPGKPGQRSRRLL